MKQRYNSNSTSYGQLKDMSNLALLKSVFDTDEDGYIDADKIKPLVATLAGTNAFTGTNTFASTSTFSGTTIVPTPTAATQAANKSYVDGQISTSVGLNPGGDNTWTGNNDFQGETSVATPTEDAHASNKGYADGLIEGLTTGDVDWDNNHDFQGNFNASGTSVVFAINQQSQDSQTVVFGEDESPKTQTIFFHDNCEVTFSGSTIYENALNGNILIEAGDTSYAYKMSGDGWAQIIPSQLQLGAYGAGNTVSIEPELLEINVDILKAYNLPTYADNAAAVAGGLAVDTIYATSTGELRIVV